MTPKSNENKLQLEAYLAGHYALGKAESQNGSPFGWRERSEFLKNFTINYLKERSEDEEPN